MFSEKSIRKQGASADVELATLRLSPSEQLIYSRDMLCVAVKKFRLGDNKDGERILAVSRSFPVIHFCITSQGSDTSSL